MINRQAGSICKYDVTNQAFNCFRLIAFAIVFLPQPPAKTTTIFRLQIAFKMKPEFALFSPVTFSEETLDAQETRRRFRIPRQQSQFRS
jgi:hypothetical protein